MWPAIPPLRLNVMCVCCSMYVWMYCKRHIYLCMYVCSLFTALCPSICRVPECLTSIRSLTVLMMNDCSLPRLPTEIGRSEHNSKFVFSYLPFKVDTCSHTNPSNSKHCKDTVNSEGHCAAWSWRSPQVCVCVFSFLLWWWSMCVSASRLSSFTALPWQGMCILTHVENVSSPVPTYVHCVWLPSSGR